MKNMNDVFQACPKSVALLKKWTANDMKKKFKDLEINPDINYDAVREEYLDREFEDFTFIESIEDNARLLFDFFDSEELFIDVDPDVSANTNSDLAVQFMYVIFDEKMNHLENNNGWIPTRKEADKAAVFEAFILLEEKLKNNEKNN